MFFDKLLCRNERSRSGGMSHICCLALLAAYGLSVSGCSTGTSSDEERSTEDVLSVLFVPGEGEVIASSGGEVLLTTQDLKERIAQQAPMMQARYQTPEGRRELVKQLVRFELLAREAARQGVHHEPQVQQALKQAMVNTLMNQQRSGFEKAADLSDERLQQYYEENISEFVRPERVRVSHVFVSSGRNSDEERRAAEQKAAELLEEIRASSHDVASTFVRVVLENTDDEASKSNRGDLRYLSKEKLAEAWGQPLADAAFELDRVGTVSDVVESDKGFHILRMIGRQRAKERELEDIRPQIMNRVRRDEQRRLFDSFVEEVELRSGLEIDSAVLDRMDETSLDGTEIGNSED